MLVYLHIEAGSGVLNNYILFVYVCTHLGVRRKDYSRF